MKPSEVNDYLRDQRQNIAQHYANAPQAQNNITAQHGYSANCLCNFCQAVRAWTVWQSMHMRLMEVADLGIIDQNLDDKIGMDL